MLQRIYFAYVFNCCIILATVNTYSKSYIKGELNDFEVSDALFRMFPNKYLRSKMAIPINEDIKRDSDDVSIGDLNLSQHQQRILRQKWRSSCDKKASKVCIKACKITYKNVCGSYKCKSAMKKSFKRECKSNCKAKFVSSKYSDSE